jgi:hypothetical protein
MLAIAHAGLMQKSRWLGQAACGGWPRWCGAVLCGATDFLGYMLKLTELAIVTLFLRTAYFIQTRILSAIQKPSGGLPYQT